MKKWDDPVTPKWSYLRARVGTLHRRLINTRNVELKTSVSFLCSFPYLFRSIFVVILRWANYLFCWEANFSTGRIKSRIRSFLFHAEKQSKFDELFTPTVLEFWLESTFSGWMKCVTLIFATCRIIVDVTKNWNVCPSEFIFKLCISISFVYQLPLLKVLQRFGLNSRCLLQDETWME